MPQESAANSTRGMEIIDVSAVDIYLNLLVSEDGILVEETNGLVCYLRDHQDLKFLYKVILTFFFQAPSKLVSVLGISLVNY